LSGVFSLIDPVELFRDIIFSFESRTAEEDRLFGIGGLSLVEETASFIDPPVAEFFLVSEGFLETDGDLSKGVAILVPLGLLFFPPSGTFSDIFGADDVVALRALVGLVDLVSDPVLEDPLTVALFGPIFQ
jgi:hypothetical protein